MRHRAFIAVLVAALALPTLASAQQPRVRDHRGGGGQTVPTRPGQPPPSVPLSVTGFAPQSGPIGTLVTITGAGFLPQTKVVLDGRPVKVESYGPNALVIRIPPRVKDGLIVLRQPGAANDLAVGRFVVEVDPVIGRFAPPFGPAGTRVEIMGSGFKAGDAVTIGTVATPVAELAPTRIVVTIPAGALSDFLIVTRPGGKQARSARPFQVTLPPPAIARFEPMSGPPGTMVRVFGANFAPDCRAFYGVRPVAIQNRGEGWVDVFLPPNVRESQPITLKAKNGVATTATPFAVVLPPALARFVPMWGAPGTRVELFGANFLRGDDVKLNNRSIRVQSAEPERLVVEIPADGQTGTFEIFRGGTKVAEADRPFEVIVPPRLASFTPAGGPVGTSVTLSGTGFTPDATVVYGVQTLRIQSRSDTALVVQIPRGASNQPFIVRTRGGEATSSQPFQVHTYSIVGAITPNSGPVGTRVWIRGRNFNPTDVFYLGGLTLAIVERQPEGYQVQIPPGAKTGLIEWDSYGRRFQSRLQFTVIEPPTLSGFTPTSGPAGTQVTITGANLTQATAVFFGNLPCTIVRRQLPSGLVVVIPPSAVGTEYLWLESSGQRIKSATTFQVIAPPAITGFAPTSGPAGTQVTITGANLTATTVVTLGQVRMPIVRSQLPGLIVVTVPPDARSDFLWIEDRGQRVRSAGAFTVIVPPAIVGIAPLSGMVGTQVTIKGERFSPQSKVWFGALACPIVKRGGATELVITVPPGAKGKGPFTVEDLGQRVASVQQFEVIAEDAPGHHEHAHPHPHPTADHHHHPHQHPHPAGSTHHHPF